MTKELPRGEVTVGIQAAVPSSTAAWRSHFDNVIGWIPNQLRPARGSCPPAGCCHLHDIVAELLGIGLGHVNILPGPPIGQASSDVTPTRGSHEPGPAADRTRPVTEWPPDVAGHDHFVPDTDHDSFLSDISAFTGTVQR